MESPGNFYRKKVALPRMTSIARVAIPVAIVLCMGYFVSQSLTNTGKDMAAKTIKDGIVGQVTYHQSIIKDDPDCSVFKARLEPVRAVTSTDEAKDKLLGINADARAASCLK